MLLIDIILLVTIIVFSVVLVKKDFRAFFIVFPFLKQALFSIPSLIYIVNGGYISEQQVLGYNNGALSFYIIYMLFTMALIVIFYKYINIETELKKLKISIINIDRLMINICILSLFILYLNLFFSTSPLFSLSIDRFNYFDNSKLPFLNILFGDTATFLAFVSGIIFIKDRNKGLTLLGFYVVYLILIGQKFGPLINTMVYFAMPFVFTRKINFSFRKLLNTKTIVGAITLFCIVYYSYSVFNPYRHVVGDSVIQAMAYRLLGLQAHIWWGAVENFIVTNHYYSFNIFELKDGMQNMMMYLAPFNVASAIERGVSFTNAYPGVLVKIFPWYLAMLIHSFFILKYIIIIKLIISSLFKKNYLQSIILFQILVWFMYMLFMGNFGKFSITLTVTILFLILSKVSITK